MAKTAEDLRSKAKQFRAKAKALENEAARLEEIEDLKLIKELKKQGKLYAAKSLITEQTDETNQV